MSLYPLPPDAYRRIRAAIDSNCVPSIDAERHAECVVSVLPVQSIAVLPEEGGVNESSSDLDGQQMSPLRGGRDLGRPRTASSTSPPAGSTAPDRLARATRIAHQDVPAPLATERSIA